MKQSFTEKVYAVVKKIPKGSALTYKEVARRAGSPRASRAVGTILSKNYNPAIPCHRVLRSDGGLGGYNRGLSKKVALLKKEGFRYTKNMKKGFTIIEIMTVIAIIAILSVIVYANVNEGRKKARDAIRIHDAQTLAKSIDSYYVEHNALPVPNTITKNVSSLDTANWESFWKNTVGIDNALVSPKNGERLEGVSSGSGVFDVVTNPIAPFRKYNYYYVIAIPDYTSPVTIVYANKPGIYVPLEQTPKSICDVGEDPATGCTPYCEDEGASFSVVGPVDSNNCSDLKKGCVMRGLNTFMGGTRAFVCVLVGPNAP